MLKSRLESHHLANRAYARSVANIAEMFRPGDIFLLLIDQVWV